MDTCVVQFSDVVFNYGDRNVLEDINLELHPGSLCVLRGANGAGKSTLLSLILGDTKPLSGEVLVFGLKPGTRKFQKELGGRIGVVPQRVPQDYRRFPVTVEELVLAGLYKKTPKILPRPKWQYEAAKKAIAAVDLSTKKDVLLSELSGGQLQRALLARAIVTEPELLILDEPTSSLDVENVAKLAEVVDGAVQSLGAACLFVTHDLARLPRCYDRVIELNQGKLDEIPLHNLDTYCHCGDFPEDLVNVAHIETELKEQ